MMTFIGVDPGETTGLFVVNRDTRAHIQEKHWDAVSRVEKLVQWAPKLVVVMEAFNVFEQRTSLARANIQWPLDVIGAVRYVCAKAEIPVIMRWNYQKNKISDELLAQFGCLAAPAHKNRHTNDAARHVVGYLLKTNDMELIDARRL